MEKLNCWEYKKCYRTPGGAKAAELGVCPAAVISTANGINQGINGGRICWAITGTLCGGQVQGTFAMKLGDCLLCEFHKLVMKEERQEFIGATNLAKNKHQ